MNSFHATATGFNAPVDLIHHGTTPGILDISQPQRILREPGSRLLFASYDALTAGGQGANLDFRKLSLDEESYKPRRVVIEISQAGACSWRFVPKAQLEEGVPDEGRWPRVIDICGRLANCSQEQWDIYKLDPCYRCVVKNYPSLSSIDRKEFQQQRAPSPLRKRPYSNTSTGSATPDKGPAPKKVHYEASVTMRSVTSDEGDTEEDEVEEMILDENYPRRRTPTAKRPRPLSSKSTANHPAQNNKPVSQAAPLRPDTTFYHQSRQAQSMPPENHKRKDFDSMDISYTRLDGRENERPVKRFNIDTNAEETKRSIKERHAKRRAKDEAKRKRWEEEAQARRLHREQMLFNAAMADVPRVPKANGNIPTQTTSMDAARAAAIEESRRKLAELEADKPIWDAAARARMAQEKEEEDERRRKKETQRRVEEDRLKMERERQRLQHLEEEQRKRQEVLQQKEKMTRDREARRARWDSGKWTHRRAIERFMENSDYFEMTRFSADIPLYTEDVPWPTLLHPSAFSLEDVDWASVEEFFDVLKTHLRTQEYISVVEKSHRRFHPDRWRSRNLFKAVLDSAERNCMEVSSTTVSQALTPIWQKVRTMKKA
ncbi:hypothetical protein FA15DRAFT_755645 [Coprinopsis marcescibilis]|uniref:Uncharacterized protein n=1 Tax=Coprinopsis marcescibilis TaxID=230819 RepID=A0A5C3LBQ3_COPMA|nr:hypothetical protein FA15DRAFT_755645 [Coprinopsis marcescibilis]